MRTTTRPLPLHVLPARGAGRTEDSVTRPTYFAAKVGGGWMIAGRPGR
jgi:hypothetical protein